MAFASDNSVGPVTTPYKPPQVIANQRKIVLPKKVTKKPSGSQFWKSKKFKDFSASLGQQRAKIDGILPKTEDVEKPVDAVVTYDKTFKANQPVFWDDLSKMYTPNNTGVPAYLLSIPDDSVNKLIVRGTVEAQKKAKELNAVAEPMTFNDNVAGYFASLDSIDPNNTTGISSEYSGEMTTNQIIDVLRPWELSKFLSPEFLSGMTEEELNSYYTNMTEQGFQFVRYGDLGPEAQAQANVMAGRGVSWATEDAERLAAFKKMTPDDFFLIQRKDVPEGGASVVWTDTKASNLVGQGGSQQLESTLLLKNPPNQLISIQNAMNTNFTFSADAMSLRMPLGVGRPQDAALDVFMANTTDKMNARFQAIANLFGSMNRLIFRKKNRVDYLHSYIDANNIEVTSKGDVRKAWHSAVWALLKDNWNQYTGAVDSNVERAKAHYLSEGSHLNIDPLNNPLNRVDWMKTFDADKDKQLAISNILREQAKQAINAGQGDLAIEYTIEAIKNDRDHYLAYWVDEDLEGLVGKDLRKARQGNFKGRTYSKLLYGIYEDWSWVINPEAEKQFMTNMAYSELQLGRPLTVFEINTLRNKYDDIWSNMAGDILLDPSTWASVGILDLAAKAVKFTKTAKAVAVADKFVGNVLKPFANIIKVNIDEANLARLSSKITGGGGGVDIASNVKIRMGFGDYLALRVPKLSVVASGNKILQDTYNFTSKLSDVVRVTRKNVDGLDFIAHIEKYVPYAEKGTIAAFRGAVRRGAIADLGNSAFQFMIELNKVVPAAQWVDYARKAQEDIYGIVQKKVLNEFEVGRLYPNLSTPKVRELIAKFTRDWVDNAVLNKAPEPDSNLNKWLNKKIDDMARTMVGKGKHATLEDAKNALRATVSGKEFDETWRPIYIDDRIMDYALRESRKGGENARKIALQFASDMKSAWLSKKGVTQLWEGANVASDALVFSILNGINPSWFTRTEIENGKIIRQLATPARTALLAARNIFKSYSNFIFSAILSGRMAYLITNYIDSNFRALVYGVKMNSSINGLFEFYRLRGGVPAELFQSQASDLISDPSTRLAKMITGEIQLKNNVFGNWALFHTFAGEDAVLKAKEDITSKVVGNIVGDQGISKWGVKRALVNIRNKYLIPVGEHMKTPWRWWVNGNAGFNNFMETAVRLRTFDKFYKANVSQLQDTFLKQVMKNVPEEKRAVVTALIRQSHNNPLKYAELMKYNDLSVFASHLIPEDVSNIFAGMDPLEVMELADPIMNQLEELVLQNIGKGLDTLDNITSSYFDEVLEAYTKEVEAKASYFEKPDNMTGWATDAVDKPDITKITEELNIKMSNPAERLPDIELRKLQSAIESNPRMTDATVRRHLKKLGIYPPAGKGKETVKVLIDAADSVVHTKPSIVDIDNATPKKTINHQEMADDFIEQEKMVIDGFSDAHKDEIHEANLRTESAFQEIYGYLKGIGTPEGNDAVNRLLTFRSRSLDLGTRARLFLTRTEGVMKWRGIEDASLRGTVYGQFESWYMNLRRQYNEQIAVLTEAFKNSATKTDIPEFNGEAFLRSLGIDMKVDDITGNIKVININTFSGKTRRISDSKKVQAFREMVFGNAGGSLSDVQRLETGMIGIDINKFDPDVEMKSIPHVKTDWSVEEIFKVKGVEDELGEGSIVRAIEKAFQGVIGTSDKLTKENLTRELMFKRLLESAERLENTGGSVIRGVSTIHELEKAIGDSDVKLNAVFENVTDAINKMAKEGVPADMAKFAKDIRKQFKEILAQKHWSEETIDKTMGIVHRAIRVFAGFQGISPDEYWVSRFAGLTTSMKNADDVLAMRVSSGGKGLTTADLESKFFGFINSADNKKWAESIGAVLDEEGGLLTFVAEHRATGSAADRILGDGHYWNRAPESAVNTDRASVLIRTSNPLVLTDDASASNRKFIRELSDIIKMDDISLEKKFGRVGADALRGMKRAVRELQGDPIDLISAFGEHKNIFTRVTKELGYDSILIKTDGMIESAITFKPQSSTAVFKQDVLDEMESLLSGTEAMTTFGVTKFLTDGRALIGLFTNSRTPVAFLHELAHVVLPDISVSEFDIFTKWASTTKFSKNFSDESLGIIIKKGQYYIPADRVLNLAQFKDLHRKVWLLQNATPEEEATYRFYQEAFANGWTQHFVVGNDMPKELQSWFKRIANAVSDFWNQIKGTHLEVKMNRPVREMFSRLQGYYNMDVFQPGVTKYVSGAAVGNIPIYEVGYAKSAGQVPSKKPRGETAGFKTEFGSTYKIDEAGTIRNEAYHPAHGTATQGLKPKSKTTWYIDDKDIDGLIATTNTEGAKFVYDGKTKLSVVTGDNTLATFTVKKKPALGLHPLELFDDDFHVGSKITELLSPSGADDVLLSYETKQMGISNKLKETEIKAKNANDNLVGDNLRRNKEVRDAKGDVASLKRRVRSITNLEAERNTIQSKIDVSSRELDALTNTKIEAVESIKASDIMQEVSRVNKFINNIQDDELRDEMSALLEWFLSGKTGPKPKVSDTATRTMASSERLLVAHGKKLRGEVAGAVRPITKQEETLRDTILEMEEKIAVINKQIGQETSKQVLQVNLAEAEQRLIDATNMVIDDAPLKKLQAEVEQIKVELDAVSEEISGYKTAGKTLTGDEFTHTRNLWGDNFYSTSNGYIGVPRSKKPERFVSFRNPLVLNEKADVDRFLKQFDILNPNPDIASAELVRAKQSLGLGGHDGLMVHGFGSPEGHYSIFDLRIDVEAQEVWDAVIQYRKLAGWRLPMTSPDAWLDAAKLKMRQALEEGNNGTALTWSSLIKSVENDLNRIPSVTDSVQKVFVSSTPLESTKEGIRSYVALAQDNVSQLERTKEVIREWKDGFHDALMKAKEGDITTGFLANPNKEYWDDLQNLTNNIVSEMNNMNDTVVRGGAYQGIKVDGALQQANKILLDYTMQYDLERLPRSIFPFWSFPSRSLPFWAETLATHPRILNAYNKYLIFSWKTRVQNGMVNSRGEPLKSYAGYIPVMGTDYWINPTAPLSFRLLFPSVYARDTYDEKSADLNMFGQVIDAIYELARLRGISIHPVSMSILRAVGLSNDQTYRNSQFPQMDLMPPFIQKSIMSWLDNSLMGINATDLAQKVPEIWTPEPDYRDALVEQMMLKDLLYRMRMVEESSNTEEEYQEEARRMAEEMRQVFMLPALARRNNEVWQKWTAKYRNQQYGKTWVGQITGFYPKKYTAMDAQFKELQNELGLLKATINDEVQMIIFELGPTMKDVEQKYKDERYNSPEGEVWSLYTASNWVTDVNGEDLTGDERMNKIANTVHQEEKSAKYYQGLNASFDILSEDLAVFPIGTPSELKKDAYDRHKARIDKLRESLEIASEAPTLFDDYSIYNKSEESILNHMRNIWWEEIVTTSPLPRYDKCDCTWDEYKASLDEWYAELPDRTSTVSAGFVKYITPQIEIMFQLDEEGRKNLTPEQIAEAEAKMGEYRQNIVSLMAKETNQDGYKKHTMENDTIYTAMHQAWNELYALPYYEALEGKSNEAWTLAKNKYTDEHKPPTFEELWSWISENYLPDQFTRDEAREAYGTSGRDPYSMDEYKEASLTDNKERTRAKILAIMDMVNQGEFYTEFNSTYRDPFRVGGTQKQLDRFWSDWESMPEEELDDILVRAEKAASLLNLKPMTETGLIRGATARQQNDDFKLLVKKTLGDNFYDIQSWFYDLDYSEQAEEKKKNPNLQRMFDKYKVMKEMQAQQYPLWASYYFRDALNPKKSTSSGGGGSGGSSGGGGGSGGRGGSSGGGMGLPDMWNYKYPTNMPMMGYRQTLDASKLISGETLGKAGAVDIPKWPKDRVMAMEFDVWQASWPSDVREVMGEQLISALRDKYVYGSQLSDSAKAFMEGIVERHPDWSPIIQGILDDLQ